MKCPSRSTCQMKCTMRSDIPPPFETVIDDRSSIGRYMSSVRAHLKLLKFTALSLLLKFTPQLYQYVLPPTNQAQISGIPLHRRSFTYSTMQIYCRQMYPPLQLTTDVWHTITANKFYILKHAHIHMADGPPMQLTIHPCYTITPKKFHI